MIKRQFYSLEHRSRDDEASSSSSSSEDDTASSSDDEEPLSVAHEEEEEEVEEDEFPASGPDYGSSDDEKSTDEANNHSLAQGPFAGEWGLHSLDEVNDNEESRTKQHRNKKQDSTKTNSSNQWAELVAETLKEKTVDFVDECVITCKTVLKCRLCPKTICLSSETMQAHLDSKKHARSLKQMKEGKLKVMLNSDGEEEEQGETHAERHARVVASFKSEVSKETPKRKRPSGRQRQRERAKRKRQSNAKKSDA